MPQNRTRTKVIIGVAVAGALVVPVAGVLTWQGLRSDDSTRSPQTLSSPLRLQRVAESGTPPCGPDTIEQIDRTACFRLDDPAMTVQEVTELAALPPDPANGQTSWTVSVRLTPEDRAGFADLTGKVAAVGPGLPSNRIAIVADNKVLSAPVVTSRITGGQFWITGDFVRADAEELIRRLTGRA